MVEIEPFLNVEVPATDPFLFLSHFWVATTFFLVPPRPFISSPSGKVRMMISGSCKRDMRAQPIFHLSLSIFSF